VIRYLIRFVLELLWWDWQLVGTFEEKITVHSDYRDREHKVYAHCFESRWGSRRVKIRIIGATELFHNSKVRATKTYQTEIYPWLKYRAHVKLPAYAIVASGKFDFLKRLKGETPVVLNDDEE